MYHRIIFSILFVLGMLLIPVTTGCEPNDKGAPTIPDSDRCEGIQLQGTPEEIAATPRQKPNLELLTLSLSKGMTADEGLYQRIVRDVNLIRSSENTVRHIQYFPPHNGKELIIRVQDFSVHQQILAGGHDIWNCLAEYYRLLDVEDFSLFDDNGLLAEFKGIYDLQRLSAVFSQIDGFEYVEPNWYGGDGPTICVKPATAAFFYVFDDASGDCPAGCINHVYYYFTTTSDGTVKFHGTYERLLEHEKIDPPPEWTKEFGPCP